MPAKDEYRTNPSKFRKLTRRWRATHRQQHRAYQQRYYRKHRKQAQRYQREWYLRNRKTVLNRVSQWAKKNRARARRNKQAWEHTPHGRTNKQKNTAVRRARIRKSEGLLTTKQWEAKLRRYEHRCARCHRRRKLHMHHIKPLADGGKNTIRNVLPLCEPCHIQTHRELKRARKLAMRAPASHS